MLQWLTRVVGTQPAISTDGRVLVLIEFRIFVSWIHLPRDPRTLLLISYVVLPLVGVLVNEHPINGAIINNWL